MSPHRIRSQLCLVFLVKGVVVLVAGYFAVAAFNWFVGVGLDSLLANLQAVLSQTVPLPLSIIPVPSQNPIAPTSYFDASILAGQLIASDSECYIFVTEDTGAINIYPTLDQTYNRYRIGVLLYSHGYVAVWGFYWHRGYLWALVKVEHIVGYVHAEPFWVGDKPFCPP